MRTCLSLLGLLLCLTLPGHPLYALESADLAQVRGLFPAADRVVGSARVAGAREAYQGTRLLGYAWLSHDVANTTGFSGLPINVWVGMDVDGRIAGARIVEQHEPILAIGVSEQNLRDFVAQYVGRDVRESVRLDRAAGAAPIAGASVSSQLLNDAILRSARLVARAYGLDGMAPAGGTGTAAIDLEAYAPADWDGLVADGSLARLLVAETGAAGTAPTGAFIDLYAGLALPQRIGRNLLGDTVYSRLMRDLPPGASAIVVVASGRYSFKGTAFTREGVFDRIQLVQDNRTIQLKAAWHERLERLRAAGTPELRELGLFSIPADSGFDPARDWRLDLLVARDGARAPEILALPYHLPDRYRRPVASAAPPVPAELPWQDVWREQRVKVAILGAMLGGLTVLLFAQDSIVRRRKLHLALRSLVLAVTLLWLGWFAGAQLSILNVFTFMNALLTGFRWNMFLLAPLIFMLWGFVALAMMFWGRGVFCGWLCPFGALQELVNRLGRAARLPQLRLPFVLHERLWPIKYVAFVGLLAVSLQGLEQVFACLEYEPFKTAIVLRFHRPWLYVLYPLALLAVGLCVERVFCRYLCPLGAALAMPAPLRTFEWLRRRRQCGTECQICASRCPVQAIHPEGRINVHECIHCLGCQVNYYDETLCPPLIERRRRRDARAAARAGVAGGD